MTAPLGGRQPILVQYNQPRQYNTQFSAPHHSTFRTYLFGHHAEGGRGGSNEGMAYRALPTAGQMGTVGGTECDRDCGGSGWGCMGLAPEREGECDVA